MWIDTKYTIPDHNSVVLVQLGYRKDEDGNENNYDVAVALYDSEKGFLPHGVVSVAPVEFNGDVVAFKLIE